MKWEYFCDSTDELDFDKLGEVGWELVSVDNRVAYFKRPLPYVDSEQVIVNMRTGEPVTMYRNSSCRVSSVERVTELVHGVNCPKAAHVGGDYGYMHNEEDDGPYDVDGVPFCGRCRSFCGHIFGISIRGGKR